MNNSHSPTKDADTERVTQAFAEIADARESLAKRTQNRLKELMPRIDQQELVWWQSRIEEAQAITPSDVHGFVETLKKFLIVFSCRLENSEGLLLAPKVNHDRNENAYIQMTGTKEGRTVTRGFKNTTLRLVCIAEAKTPETGAEASIGDPK